MARSGSLSCARRLQLLLQFGVVFCQRIDLVLQGFENLRVSRRRNGGYACLGDGVSRKRDSGNACWRTGGFQLRLQLGILSRETINADLLLLQFLQIFGSLRRRFTDSSRFFHLNVNPGLLDRRQGLYLPDRLALHRCGVRHI